MSRRPATKPMRVPRATFHPRSAERSVRSYSYGTVILPTSSQTAWNRTYPGKTTRSELLL